MADEKYQGIIVFWRIGAIGPAYPWSTYFAPALKEEFDSYVESGYIPDEVGGMDETTIISSRWLDEPLDWKGIRKIGEEMQNQAKK